MTLLALWLVLPRYGRERRTPVIQAEPGWLVQSQVDLHPFVRMGHCGVLHKPCAWSRGTLASWLADAGGCGGPL